MDLAQKKCVPCERGTPPLNTESIDEYLGSLDQPWRLVDNGKIQHTWKFKNFQQAMEFVTKVAELAEHEGHHPDMHISYNTVTLELSTHSIGGLSENDFILARKIELIA